MEFLKRTVLTLSAVLVLGTIIVTTAVNWYGLQGFQNALEHSTGLDAQVSSAKLGLFSRVRFNGITLTTSNNDQAEMWRANWVRLDAQPENLTRQNVFAETLHITGLSLLLLRSGKDQSNYKALLENMDRALRPDDNEADDRAENSSREKKFLVSQAEISDLSIRGIDKSTGEGPSDVTVNIENIQLKKLGTTKNGMSIDELTASVLYGVLHHVAYRERDLPPAITRELRLALSQLPHPDAELPSRSRTLGEKAGEQGQAFFDKAIEAIDKFMESDPNQILVPEEKLE